jgi:predicted alpha/beta superfamily hydrolase
MRSIPDFCCGDVVNSIFRTIKCLIHCSVIIALTASALFSIEDETTADAKAVQVRLEVSIPDDGDDNGSHPDVFLAGNIRPFGRWRPDGLKLARGDDGVYRAEFSAPPDTNVEFKATLGTWQSVEKDAEGRDIPNREFKVMAPENGLPQLIRITVERWSSQRHPQASSITGNMILHEQVVSKHLTRPRNVSVWLPPGYDESGGRYPVLYLHDGQNLFDQSTAAFGVEWQVDETATRLMEAKEIPPVIIVGIWNTPERIEEYTVTKDRRLEQGGRGLDYIQFLTSELKPLIDRTYRTRPEQDSTYIGGSSLGGLISLHACMEQPDVFGKCFAFSPSLGWDEERLLESLNTGRVWPQTVQLWFSMGTNEGRGATAQAANLERAQRLRDLLKPAKAESTVPVHFHEFEKGTHDEKSWALQFSVALKSMLSPPAHHD